MTHCGGAASIGRLRVVGLLLLGLPVAACVTSSFVPSRVATGPLRAASLDEVLAAYDGYCNAIETLSASGDLDVRDLGAGKAYKLGVRLVARRGGHLYLKGSVAVITALEVVADGERFWFQVPSKKTVWTGAAAGAATSEAGTDQAPYYALRPMDVTEALLPEPLTPGPDEWLILEADQQAFSLTLARAPDGRGTAQRRVWLARDTLLPLRARRFDERGDVVSEVGFGGFRDGLPRFVQVERPGERYQASFSFSRLEANLTVPERAFVPRLPEGYRVVEVR